MTGLRYQRCRKYKEVSLNCTVILNPKQSRTGERRDLYTHSQTYTRTFSSGWPPMHTNGFCHLWRSKIYDFLRRAVNRTTQQKTLASQSILPGLHMKGGKLSRCCVGGGEDSGDQNSPVSRFAISSRLAAAMQENAAFVNNQPYYFSSEKC